MEGVLKVKRKEVIAAATLASDMHGEVAHRVLERQRTANKQRPHPGPRGTLQGLLHRAALKCLQHI